MALARSASGPGGLSINTGAANLLYVLWNAVFACSLWPAFSGLQCSVWNESLPWVLNGHTAAPAPARRQQAAVSSERRRRSRRNLLGCLGPRQTSPNSRAVSSVGHRVRLRRSHRREACLASNSNNRNNSRPVACSASNSLNSRLAACSASNSNNSSRPAACLASNSNNRSRRRRAVVSLDRQALKSQH